MFTYLESQIDDRIKRSPLLFFIILLGIEVFIGNIFIWFLETDDSHTDWMTHLTNALGVASLFILPGFYGNCIVIRRQIINNFTQCLSLIRGVQLLIENKQNEKKINSKISQLIKHLHQTQHGNHEVIQGSAARIVSDIKKIVHESRKILEFKNQENAIRSTDSVQTIDQFMKQFDGIMLSLFDLISMSLGPGNMLIIMVMLIIQFGVILPLIFIGKEGHVLMSIGHLLISSIASSWFIHAIYVRNPFNGGKKNSEINILYEAHKRMMEWDKNI
jgi:hypothetical protein